MLTTKYFCVIHNVLRVTRFMLTITQFCLLYNFEADQIHANHKIVFIYYIMVMVNRFMPTIKQFCALHNVEGDQIHTDHKNSYVYYIMLRVTRFTLTTKQLCLLHNVICHRRKDMLGQNALQGVCLTFHLHRCSNSETKILAQFPAMYYKDQYTKAVTLHH